MELIVNRIAQLTLILVATFAGLCYILGLPDDKIPSGKYWVLAGKIVCLMCVGSIFWCTIDWIIKTF